MEEVLRKDSPAATAIRQGFLEKERFLSKKERRQKEALRYALAHNGTCKTYFADLVLQETYIFALQADIEKTKVARRTNFAIMEAILDPKNFGLCPRCERPITVERLLLMMSLPTVEKLCDCPQSKSH